MNRLLNKGRPIVLLLITAMLLISCMPETPTESPEVPKETGEAVVTMQNLSFEPAELIISAGTTVTWTNEDNVGHTVTAGTIGSPTGLFDENVPAGASLSYTFDEPGTYDYYCSIHPGMDGTVIVE